MKSGIDNFILFKCVSLTDYRMTYTSTEHVLEKYKIEHSVTTDKNLTDDI